jgi:hypothetical protein
MESESMRAGLMQWQSKHPQATWEESEQVVYRRLTLLHAEWVGEAAPAAPERAAETSAASRTSRHAWPIYGAPLPPKT